MSCPTTKGSPARLLVPVLVLLIGSTPGCKSRTSPTTNQTAVPQRGGSGGVTLPPNSAPQPQASSAQSKAAYPEWKSPGSDSWKIPLRAGLTVVTAIAHPDVGDYESIKKMQKVSADAVEISYSSDIPNANARSSGSSQSGGGNSTRQSCVRTVLRQDLRSAAEYRENFCQSREESYPGTTAISISAQTLADLKTKGEAAFKYQQTETKGPPDETCTLKRAEPVDLALPVLVNDRRVQLPAVHARCTSKEDDEDSEFYFLDDPENALALAWQLGLGNKLQVVKISFPTDAPEIEQSLEQSGRAQVYGIYFDFGSATIRPESEPVLKQIADALAKNPSWKLRVEGHTDNIGSDASNLELSLHRAEAVKQALVDRYRVQPDRLTTAGFGASRPEESNDTLEGRARNRRVELVR
jgi:outer membrane protein OmpA-like peptidoglycan-associated protein